MNCKSEARKQKNALCFSARKKLLYAVSPQKSKRHWVLFSLLIASQVIFFVLAAMNNITPQKASSTGLPILYVETVAAKSIKSKTDYRKAVYSIEGNSGRCRIRGRGNTTWKTREFVKKPYLLKLDDAAPLLGMNAARKWVLIANTADKTMLRNAYAFHLARTVFDKNIATPNCAFVQLFLNGRYNGLYLLTEKPDFDDNRLANFGSAAHDGNAGGPFIAEVRGRFDKEINITTARGVTFALRSPKITGGQAGARERMKDYCQLTLQNAEDSVYSAGRDNRFADWGGLLDIDSFVDWYWVNELTKNHDAHFQSSCFLVWDAELGRLFMGPVWDFDISCGNISSDGCENPAGLWVCERYWFAALMANDKMFQRAVWERWNEKQGEAADSLEWLESEAARLKAAIELDESVFPKIGRRQWPHPPSWKERQTYRAELDYMKRFLQERIKWLNEVPFREASLNLKGNWRQQ